MTKSVEKAQRKLGLASYYEAVALLRHARRKSRANVNRRRRRRLPRELPTETIGLAPLPETAPPPAR